MRRSSRAKFPFNKLPMELKMKVITFDALVVGRSTRNRQSLRKRAMVLGLVCREWREVVLSRPELWSMIYVNFYFYSHNKNIFDMYIKNSKDYPLDVHIAFGDDDRDIDEGCQMLQVLRNEGHRLKILELYFGTLDRQMPVDIASLDSNTNRLVKSHLPILEMVEIGREDVDEGLDIGFRRMFCDSPLLRDLTVTLLDLGPSTFSSCKQVTTLKLEYVSIRLWIQAITSLPNLTHTSFHGFKHMEDDTEVPRRFRFSDGSNVFVHNTLSSMELITGDWDDSWTAAIVFLKSISFPSLTKFFYSYLRFRYRKQHPWSCSNLSESI